MTAKADKTNTLFLSMLTEMSSYNWSTWKELSIIGTTFECTRENFSFCLLCNERENGFIEL